jgi:hypothetical protein
MNTNQRRLRRGVAAACLVGAIAAPAASADSISPSEQITQATEAARSTDPSQSTRYRALLAVTEGRADESSAPAPGADRNRHIRDGSRAVPFVPWVNGEPPAVTADGFDWGHAGIGAGATLALAAIAAGAALVTGRRPGRSVAQAPSRS